MITKALQTYARLQAAIHRHEQKEVELNRQDLLDLTDMTLPDLEREHDAVHRRLEDKRYDPEGRELLKEREDNLVRKIKQIRRTR